MNSVAVPLHPITLQRKPTRRRSQKTPPPAPVVHLMSENHMLRPGSGIHPPRSVFINHRSRDHRLLEYVPRTLRPTSRDDALTLWTPTTRQRQPTSKMRRRPVPLRPQVRDVVHQSRQPPADRLPQNQRLRQPQISTHLIKRERERPRDAQLQLRVQRLPRHPKRRQLSVVEVRCISHRPKPSSRSVYSADAEPQVRAARARGIHLHQPKPLRASPATGDTPHSPRSSRSNPNPIAKPNR